MLYLQSLNTANVRRTGARIKKIEPKVVEIVINKALLSYKTSRIVGGVKPSVLSGRARGGGQGDAAHRARCNGRMPRHVNGHSKFPTCGHRKVPTPG